MVVAIGRCPHRQFTSLVNGSLQWHSSESINHSLSPPLFWFCMRSFLAGSLFRLDTLCGTETALWLAYHRRGKQVVSFRLAIITRSTMQWITDLDTLLSRVPSRSFIWDVYDAVLYQSAGFIVHGLACLAIFAFSFVSLVFTSPLRE